MVIAERSADESRAGAPEAPQHEVAIIGAGLSGIGMAIALRDAGLEDFVILERAAEVGGTWRDNTYPGVGSDIPAQAYQFSFELKPDWQAVFAKGEEIQDYILRLVEHYELRDRVRFSSEVKQRSWDAENQLWRLRLPDGALTARYVVSAIGAFVDPKPLDIPGLADFEGKVIHAARWDHAYELAGKRAAIIGTGASAVQIIPRIARELEHLDVYQRTAIWVAPRPNPKTPRAVEALYRKVPPVQRAVRSIVAGGAEVALNSVVIHHRRAPFLAKGAEAFLRGRWYASQVPDPVLRAKLTPDYGLGCKRPAVSNRYLRTFTRENVELITDPIEAITASGIRTREGAEREIDTLILATGFRLATEPENYRRTPVHGRDGFDLATAYSEDRVTSYEGVSMPGLPNHFMIFGPYGFVGGTWHTMIEVDSAHIVRVIEAARERGSTEVEIGAEACERWVNSVRGRLAKSLWHHNNCGPSNSYYFDQHGDTPFLRPTTSLQAARASRRFPLGDYEFRPPRAAAELAR